jgi:catechol 2,3-dioxygenase-like lactoylglutathione lyase family enzyme
MRDPNFLILYVGSPAMSAAFYERLLGRKPADASPNFAMFALDGGLMLGLWARSDVRPPARLAGGGHEICFTAQDNAAVDQLHARWREQGLPIAQAPVEMDFGYTFTALDPDEHRLRVFAPRPN